MCEMLELRQMLSAEFGASLSVESLRTEALGAEALSALPETTVWVAGSEALMSSAAAVGDEDVACRPLAGGEQKFAVDGISAGSGDSLARSGDDEIIMGPVEFTGQIRSIPLPPINQIDAFRQQLKEGGYDYSPRGRNDGSSPFRLGSLALEDTFFLHSRPGASKTIFLDFDGFTATGTPWNTSYNRDPIVSPAYDPAGNGPSFTNAELRVIQEIWHRVAEDFAPFEVNVTTEDPGEAALVNTGGADTEWGIRVVMTIDDWASCGCGGFAYINSFNWNYNRAGATDTPTYVFNVVPSEVVLAITHEVGHTLGLSHDGTTSSNPVQPGAEYYFGHGSGETGWGPVMGAPYYTNVVTWDRGEYIGANNGGSNANYNRGPDDLSIITTFNGFGYRADDHGDVQSSATELVYLGANSAEPTLVDVAHFGIIEQSDDVDMFYFVTGEGTVNLNIQSYAGQAWIPDGSGGYESVLEETLFSNNWGDVNSSNLDVLARLYDLSGNLIATSNPTGLSAAFTNVDLAGGTYFISIEGTGFGNPTDASSPTGYTRYGSLGQFYISGTIVETGGPVASAVSQDVYYRVNSPLTITVTYTDRNGVDVSTINTGDIRVVGPNGYDRTATFVSVNNNSNGTPRIATYTVPPPSGGAWDSAANGSYTIKLQADEVRDVDGFFNEPADIGIINVDVAPTLGPDGRGYLGYPIQYQFTNISGTGTRILGGQDDVSQLVVPGNGFAFEFYGTTYDRLHVSSNGLITFGSPYSLYINTDLTSAPVPPTIAVLWDDLIAPANQGVYWQVLGSGNSQRLVLQWETGFFNASGGISFQAVLNEADMSISTFYRDLAGGSSGSDEAGSATIGIKDNGPQGANRLLASFDTPSGSYVRTGRGLRFAVEATPPTDLWLNPEQNTENSPIGTTVARLQVADSDPNDSHSFELILGDGDTDNAAFEIVGNQLRNLEALDFETKASYSIRVRVTDQFGFTYEEPLTLGIVDLPELEQIVVGDGTAQRSRVDRVQLVFDGAVTIDSGAFAVARRGTGGGTVATSFTTTLDGLGRTVATLSFSGSFTRGGGALVDGNYQLLVDASKISRGGRELDGQRDGIAGGNVEFGTAATDKFFALFGDLSGDRNVSLAELVQFRSAYGSASGSANYNQALDFNNDGIIGLMDFTNFRSRYGTTLGF